MGKMSTSLSHSGTAKYSKVTVLDNGKTVASADQIEERLYKIDNWEQHEASVK